MSNQIEKEFTNGATTPVTIKVIAVYDENAIVRAIHASGGKIAETKLEVSEQRRMWEWVCVTFIGQRTEMFRHHNGVVPAPSFAGPIPRDTPPSVLAAVRTARALLRPKVRATFPELREPRITAMPPELGMPYGDEASRLPRRMLYTIPCRFNLADAIMQKNPKLNPEFPHVMPDTMMPREQIEAAVSEYRETHPEVAGFFQDMLDAVPHYGKELPPKVGEFYFSVVNNFAYEVLRVERKKGHETDYTVTMQRTSDQHRTKFTFRSHADWLVTWRPLDHENRVRETVQVDLAEIEQQEAAHAAEKMVDAERQLLVIYRELDKRLPSWQDRPAKVDWPLDDCAMALRAIRKLARGYRAANAARNELADAKREAGMAEHTIYALKAERDEAIAKRDESRVVPAIGSVWRNNSTGSYQTVTHVHGGGLLCRMKSAKNTEFDANIEALFRNYSLVTGPELNMLALGNMQCNAYGLHNRQKVLKDFIEGNVFCPMDYSMQADGRVLIEGYTKPLQKPQS